MLQTLWLALGAGVNRRTFLQSLLALFPFAALPAVRAPDAWAAEFYERLEQKWGADAPPGTYANEALGEQLHWETGYRPWDAAPNAIVPKHVMRPIEFFELYEPEETP